MLISTGIALMVLSTTRISLSITTQRILNSPPCAPPEVSGRVGLTMPNQARVTFTWSAPTVAFVLGTQVTASVLKDTWDLLASAPHALPDAVDMDHAPQFKT